MKRSLIPHGFYLFFFILLSCFLHLACGKISAKEPLPEGYKKFIEICQNEYNLPVVVNPLKNTVWIYLPQKENILELKAAEQKSADSNQAKESVSIKFLDGKFTDGVFQLEYDIAPSKTYTQNYGYANQYSEPYQKNYRNLLTIIYRSFSDFPNSPDFFILVIADINNGIEIKTTLYLKDLLRGTSDQSFQEEYVKRMIVNYPVGNVDIVGDDTGGHINYQELTWPEFLIEQALYRLRFQYKQSSFPPSSDTKKEILQIIKETLEAYHFEDFDAIELNDLNTNSVEKIEKFQLKEIPLTNHNPAQPH